MSYGRTGRARRKLLLTGLLAWLLAFISPLDVAAFDDLAAFDPASVLCHAGAADPAPVPQPHHHDHRCAVCPLAVALALPAVIPSADPVLPEPGDALPLRFAPGPQARAPPSRPLAIAYPRGPPVLA